MLKKQLLLLQFFTIFAVFVFASSSSVQKKEQVENLRYNKTIRAFMKDNKTITNLVNKAYAYVVFPSVKKGGAVIGMAYGDGRAFRRGMWIGDVSIMQYTVGLQLGGQIYSEIIFFKTQKAFESFKKGGFEDSIQSSFVPFYSGLSGDVNFAEDVVVYTSSKGGLMVEASTGGQEFTYKSRE